MYVEVVMSDNVNNINKFNQISKEFGNNSVDNELNNNVRKRSNSVVITKDEQKNIDSLRKSIVNDNKKIGDDWTKLTQNDDSNALLNKAISKNEANKVLIGIDKKLFISEFKKDPDSNKLTFIDKKSMPGLFKLQNLASGCPLDFKTKCSKQKFFLLHYRLQ